MATLAELASAVEARMLSGDSFSRVEDDVINPSLLDEERKSALWLYGWSFVGAGAQRREALAHIERQAELDRLRAGVRPPQAFHSR
jgi:hypothetical protein